MLETFKKYKTPQKDGLETVYEDGTRLVGTWNSRLTKYRELNLDKIPKDDLLFDILKETVNQLYTCTYNDYNSNRVVLLNILAMLLGIDSKEINNNFIDNLHKEIDLMELDQFVYDNKVDSKSFLEDIQKTKLC